MGWLSFKSSLSLGLGANSDEDELRASSDCIDSAAVSLKTLSDSSALNDSVYVALLGKDNEAGALLCEGTEPLNLPRVSFV